MLPNLFLLVVFMTALSNSSTCIPRSSVVVVPPEAVNSLLKVLFTIAKLAKNIHPDELGLSADCAGIFSFPSQHAEDTVAIKSWFREHLSDYRAYLNNLKASPLSARFISAQGIVDLLSSVEALTESLKQETLTIFRSGAVTFPNNWQGDTAEQDQ